MKSRELVKRAIEFRNPSRIPACMPEPYWNDFYFVQIEPFDEKNRKWDRVSESMEESTDIWGNRWARTDAIYKGEVIKGALENIHDAATIALPDTGNPAYYLKVKAQAEKEAGGKYKMGWMHGPAFNIVRKMRKLEIYMTDLYLYPDEIAIIHERIVDLFVRMITGQSQQIRDSSVLAERWIGCILRGADYPDKKDNL